MDLRPYIIRSIKSPVPGTLLLRVELGVLLMVHLGTSCMIDENASLSRSQVIHMLVTACL